MAASYSKNHYIPEFFLKHFTADDNHFHVYDKLEKVKHKRINRKSPAQVCYEWDRYSFYSNSGERNTLMEEKIYQYFDNSHANTFDSLVSTVLTELPWTFENVGNLEFFIPLLYWRSPISDSILRTKMSNTAYLDELGLIVTKDKNNYRNTDIDFHNKVLKDHNFRKGIVPSLASNTFGQPHSVYDKLEWRLLTRNTSGVNLVSDNPILFIKEPLDFIDFRSSLILPISNSRTLIRIDENKPDNYHNQLLQDFAIIDQAVRYVISSDLEYLKSVLSLYEEYVHNGQKPTLQASLFAKYVDN